MSLYLSFQTEIVQMYLWQCWQPLEPSLSRKKLEISHCEKEALVIEVVVAPSFWVKSQNNVILGENQSLYALHILVEHEFSIHIVFYYVIDQRSQKYPPTLKCNFFC